MRLDHDTAAPFWSPPVWRQLSNGAAQAALQLAADHDQVAVIAVDTPFAGTGAAYTELAAGSGHRSGRVRILLALYGTTHIHDHPEPDPARLAWEHAGLAAARDTRVHVAGIGDFLTGHLVARYGLDPSRLVAWKSSLDLTAPDLAPMPPGQAVATAATHGVPLDRPIVLTIGRTDPTKGVDLLIDALAPLRDRVHLVAVVVPFDGHDPLLDDYRRRIDAARLRATLVPRFTRDLPRALASLPTTRVVACPSRGDSLANVPFEIALWARHAGPVVLAPHRDGFPEQITDGVNGLLYDPDGPGALTGGIVRALTLGEAAHARLRRAAYQRVAGSRDVVPNLARTLRVLFGPAPAAR
jgi:D-inositol-3-phosphate glycosyltransferase